VCGSSIGSSVSITGASGFVLIGDPRDDSCAANHIASSVNLSSNNGAVELGHNRIGSSVSVSGTTGAASTEDQGAEIEGNTIGTSLSCSGNSVATNDGQPNSVGSSRTGQCGAPGF
jgi:hypothetical protein